MDRLLRPDKFSTLHTDPLAEKKWRYWKRCFQNFQTKINETVPAADASAEAKAQADSLKLELLINYVEPEIYEYFSEESTLNQRAITVLNGFMRNR